MVRCLYRVTQQRTLGGAAAPAGSGFVKQAATPHQRPLGALQRTLLSRRAPCGKINRAKPLCAGGTAYRFNQSASALQSVDRRPEALLR